MGGELHEVAELDVELLREAEQMNGDRDSLAPLPGGDGRDRDAERLRDVVAALPELLPASLEELSDHLGTGETVIASDATVKQVPAECNPDCVAHPSRGGHARGMTEDERTIRRNDLLRHVAAQLRRLQGLSDQSQKEGAAAAGIAPQTVGYWLAAETDVALANPAQVDKLALYTWAMGGEMILELWHPKEDRRTVVATKAGAEAAVAVDSLDGRQQVLVLRLLRIAQHMTKGDWRGLEGHITSVEEDEEETAG